MTIFGCQFDGAATAAFAGGGFLPSQSTTQFANPSSVFPAGIFFERKLLQLVHGVIDGRAGRAENLLASLIPRDGNFRPLKPPVVNSSEAVDQVVTYPRKKQQTSSKPMWKREITNCSSYLRFDLRLTQAPPCVPFIQNMEPGHCLRGQKLR
ncbi:hypothetical protein NL676_034703 [Syzygium grande]|nr:hypothetical protein NL676_034703 [Syzygium grande]